MAGMMAAQLQLQSAAVVSEGSQDFSLQRTGANGRRLNRERLSRLYRIFREMDINDDGTVSLLELRVLWKLMFPDLAADACCRETERIFRIIDTNRDGRITWAEMLDYFDARNAADADDGIVDLLYEEDGDEILPRPTTPREWLWALMEQSSANMYALIRLRRISLVIQIFMQVVILTSVALMMIDSRTEMIDKSWCTCNSDTCEVDQLYDSCEGGNDVTRVMEAICISLFTIEFGLRVFSTPSQSSYWRSGWTWVDLISVVPFYLSKTGWLDPSSPGNSLVVLRVLRMVRLARVLRMLKLGKNLKSIQVMMVALVRAKIALVLMCVMMLMTIVFFSSLMYFLERTDCVFDRKTSLWMRGNDTKKYGKYANQAIYFQSIPDTMWWGLATVTTVGYGDVYPITPIGKVIASLTMVTGILVVSYPITILTNSFATVAEEFREEEIRKRRRDAFDARVRNAASDCERSGGRWFMEAAREFEYEGAAITPHSSAQQHAKRRNSWESPSAAQSAVAAARYQLLMKYEDGPPDSAIRRQDTQGSRSMMLGGATASISKMPPGVPRSRIDGTSPPRTDLDRQLEMDRQRQDWQAMEEREAARGQPGPLGDSAESGVMQVTGMSPVTCTDAGHVNTSADTRGTDGDTANAGGKRERQSVGWKEQRRDGGDLAETLRRITVSVEAQAYQQAELLRRVKTVEELQSGMLRRLGGVTAETEAPG